MKTRKPFLLRIAPKLYDELEAWAAQELRSVNGQIEYLLKAAVEKRTGKPTDRGEQIAEAPSDGSASSGEC